MKAILIAYLFSLNANAGNFIAKSELPLSVGVVPLVDGRGIKPCGAKDPCISFDGVEWACAYWDLKKLTNDSACMSSLSALRAAAASTLAANKKTMADAKVKACACDVSNDLCAYIKARDCQ